jgi:hypothetical protein
MDTARFDEVGERSFADADMASDFDELDPPFSDQTADEANGCTHVVSRCLDGQQPVRIFGVVAH